VWAVLFFQEYWWLEDEGAYVLEAWQEWGLLNGLLDGVFIHFVWVIKGRKYICSMFGDLWVAIFVVLGDR